MIDPIHLRRYVIVPALKYLGKKYCSEASVRLLLGTALVESGLGTYLKQHGDGPAEGIYQMERATHDSLWQHYLPQYPELSEKLADISPVGDLIGNLRYATAMTRVYYWQFEEPLPDRNDIGGLGWYWKNYYNTPAGKGKVPKYVFLYNKHILNKPFN